jgi:WD40 repeat protein/serine/threonine protein kinase
MPSSGSRSEIVLALAEEFIDRYRRGERPRLREYIDRHPELEADIREAFPAMAMMENIALADESLADDEPASRERQRPENLQQLGDYRIVREVGRGGMGVVYEAEQVSLGRHVALKVLPRKMLLDPKQRRRFEREAKAAAKLHHTNIVPVFGVGEHDGLPYYVMQFIQGQGLDEVLHEVKRLQAGGPPPASPDRPGRSDLSAAVVARSLVTGAFQPSGEPAASAAGWGSDPAADAAGSPLSGSSVSLPGQTGVPGRTGSGRKPTYWQSVARIGLQVAEALEYAHRQGVLHRDVKPSNLLLDLQGTVWVADFGLAKADDSENLTHTGDILGTLRYMPPEAFAGRADARGDVYALGLTLYELLALRPAYTVKDRHQLIKQVTEAEPPPLRKLRPEVPRDLETIVHKAIDRDPARRYQTAGELAADLQRFCDDEPIRARRISPAERLGRWCRRNPVLAGMAAGILVLTLGGIGGILWQWQKAERAAASEWEARRDRERTLTDMYTSFGLAAAARDDPRQAVLWFAYAARLAGSDRERADANRTRVAAWGRLAIQPVRAVVHPPGWNEEKLAFHPSGRYLLTHGSGLAINESPCRLWNLEHEAALAFPGNSGLVSAAAWDTAGERLAVGTWQGEVTIFRFPGGELLQRVPYAGYISALLFSPDGRYCALTAGNRVRVWDCRQAAFCTPELEHPMPVYALAFHPQGELLATGCQDNTCRVYAVPTEQNSPLITPVSHTLKLWANAIWSPISPCFLDEGRVLLTVFQGEASWRDSRTGRVLRVLPFGPQSRFSAFALSGDGKHLILAAVLPDGQQQARIVDVASAQPVSSNLGNRVYQPAESAAFSPNGQMLLTGSGDRTARLWSVPQGAPLGSPLAHATGVRSVAFAPDGRHLITSQWGGLTRLWALPTGNPRDDRVPLGAPSFVRLSVDGRFLLPTGLSNEKCELRSTQVVDLTTGRRVGSPLEANGYILDAAFSPDGLQVAAAVSLAVSSAERRDQYKQHPGKLLFWDWRTGKLQHEPFSLPSEPRGLDYSPDGRQLAVISTDGELRLIDPTTGKAIRQWQAHPPHLRNDNHTNNGTVRFSPDGRSLLTFGTPTNSVRVWNATTAQLRHEFKHKNRCLGVRFSADGKLIATAGVDNLVCVWDFATGEQLASFPHPDRTYPAQFSPDGQHLLTACRDGMARLWDWRAGRLVCPPFEHEHEVHAAAFTPDGRHVLSASDDGILKVWEWRTGKPVCPPFALGGAGLSLAVTPDGKRVAVGGFMKELPVFRLDDWLTPAPLEPDDLCLWGEIVSGQRIETGGGVTNLTADEWLLRWRDFRARHPGRAVAP